MYNEILIRYGEIALKGKNRSYFVNKLIDNIRAATRKLGKFKINKTYGRIYISPEGNAGELIKRLKMIPGIVSVSPAITASLAYDEIKETCLELFCQEVKKYPSTFRVKTRRANKSFPGTSPEISRDIGAYILSSINEKENILTVDLEEPDNTLYLEIRNDRAFIYTRIIPGPGGLPVGTSEKGLLLLSGGIDSPVAGWSVMRRGMELEAVYFHSFPYTGERAREKVIDLTRILSSYTGPIKLHVAYFTGIQQAIQEKCNPRYYITIMRRMMIRIACRIAEMNNDLVLVTGENLGQVASQTLESISVINKVADIPVLRPLITRDKNEIIDTAREIGTYETSILPYQDCCTIMVPDNPVTKPGLEETIRAEAGLNIEPLIKEAIEKTETLVIE